MGSDSFHYVTYHFLIFIIVFKVKNEKFRSFIGPDSTNDLSVLSLHFLHPSPRLQQQQVLDELPRGDIPQFHRPILRAGHHEFADDLDASDPATVLLGSS